MNKPASVGEIWSAKVRLGDNARWLEGYWLITDISMVGVEYLYFFMPLTPEIDASYCYQTSKPIMEDNMWTLRS